jgi:hypothetical protein
MAFVQKEAFAIAICAVLKQQRIYPTNNNQRFLSAAAVRSTTT